jgi:hypothetical protein
MTEPESIQFPPIPKDMQRWLDEGNRLQSLADKITPVAPLDATEFIEGAEEFKRQLVIILRVPPEYIGVDITGVVM